MSLRRLFQFFLKNDTYMQQIHRKITAIEKQLHKLDESKLKEHELAEPWQPPIVVEKIHIERLHLDKFELNNNFGQLGIKDLGGTLNIGATYGVGTPFPFKKDTRDDNENGESQQTSGYASSQKEYKVNSAGPKINIQAKKNEDNLDEDQRAEDK